MPSLPLAGEIPQYDGDMEADLQQVSQNRLAEKITGGLSRPGKMPSVAWGISAHRCKVGSVLRAKENSTCASCYALKGHYLFSQVQAAQERRYEGLFHPQWTPAMVFLIRWYADKYFRWFDSGDLQGENHLRNIVRVATETPQVSHWLPTREAQTVRTVFAVTERPDNLVVRLSAAQVDGRPPKWPTTSIVVTEGATCPASEQGGRCGKCRDCWDRDVANVSYPLH